MTTRVWTKNETQGTIKALRKEGYVVEKKSEGHYICMFEIDGKLQNIFEALANYGHVTGYLVRYNSRLFRNERGLENT